MQCRWGLDRFQVKPAARQTLVLQTFTEVPDLVLVQRLVGTPLGGVQRGEIVPVKAVGVVLLNPKNRSAPNAMVAAKPPGIVVRIRIVRIMASSPLSMVRAFGPQPLPPAKAMDGAASPRQASWPHRAAWAAMITGVEN